MVQQKGAYPKSQQVFYVNAWSFEEVKVRQRKTSIGTIQTMQLFNNTACQLYRF